MLASVQADGYLRHWHVSSQKLMREEIETPDNDLMCMDYNASGTLLANAGGDGIIRIQDEVTKK